MNDLLTREELQKLAASTEAAVGRQILTLGKLTTTARNGLWELDEKYIGTSDYMGIAYFWDISYKWELRDASPDVRRAVHAAFLAAHLKVGDVSDKHEAIIKKLVR